MLATLTSTSAAADVVAIVDERNSIEAITLQEVRLLFSLYRRSWDGGIRVVLILPEVGTASMRFLASVVFRDRESIEIEAYYRTATFQNRIAGPPHVASARAAIALVRPEAGSIALVEREYVTDPVGVRVLEILQKRSRTTASDSVRFGRDSQQTTGGSIGHFWVHRRTKIDLFLISEFRESWYTDRCASWSRSAADQVRRWAAVVPDQLRTRPFHANDVTPRAVCT